MLIQIFKVLTATLLIGTLIFLVSKRTFTLPHTSSSPQVTAPEQTPKEALTPQETQPSPAPTPQTGAATLEQKVATLEKNTAVYETLNKGTSDTDETYRPKVSPCKLAMGYKIGTFDTRFGISQESFIKTLDQAASLWEEGLGRRLFYYDEKGPLTVNLVYDERQAETEIINDLANEIENSKDVARSLEKTHKEEREIYLADMEEFTQDSDAFQRRYKEYSAKVDTYNAQGGAPEGEYEAMKLELETLQKEAKNLDARRASLVATVDSINAKVVRYNELVAYINGLIKKSNSLGAAKFTEGRFVPKTNTVDIYQYNDKTKLLRVTTHELGHVLGINHNENPLSIMYSVNTSTTTTLSDDDREALAKVCNSQ
jgi:predicted Zn-dependent protease